MNLYEIDQEYKSILAAIEENDGVIPEDLEQQFDSIIVERNKKISNIVRFIRNLDSQGEQVIKEIDRLKSIKDSTAKKIDWLKNYLSAVVGENNKFELPEGKISWRKSESTSITNEELIPQKFVKTIQMTSIDKVAIKNAIKAGEAVSGAELVTNNNIQIR